jgi:CPA1 family monovalent cation:H+ antiporter
MFGERITELAGEIIERRREAVGDGFDAMRLQYPDYVGALEIRFLRQSALRQEMQRYQALFEEGLIPQELYDDLQRGVSSASTAEPRPRFDIGLDTRRLIEGLDILSGLDDRQLDHVARLLRPRFTVPNERIVRKGNRGDAVFFIASGAVEVALPARRVRLGSGEFFGEMALLSGQPRQADVTALTYCQLLALRRTDFERFMSTNPEARATIDLITQKRAWMNQADRERVAEDASP